MFGTFFLSKMSLGEDVTLVVGRVGPGSVRPAVFWRSFFSSRIGVFLEVPGIVCSLQAFSVSAFFSASILVYCSFVLSVTWLILLLSYL